jgi:hypothetical protein
MTEKEFELSDGVFTVTVSGFQGPVEGKLSGPPEDCYPSESAEVEFEEMVQVPDGKPITFDDFLGIYASEYTNDDTTKAQNEIEDAAIEEILEAASEYEP